MQKYSIKFLKNWRHKGSQKNIHIDLGKWIDFRKWYFVRDEFLAINPAGYKKRQQWQKLAMKK